MKKFIALLFGILIATVVDARGHQGGGGHVSVSGYTKSNGTYVQPHHRTAPDGIKTNNWSHVGNVNPYTGKVGTNTDSSPNYRSGYQSQGGYILPAHTNQQIGSHYVGSHHDLHNTRTAADYLD